MNLIHVIWVLIIVQIGLMCLILVTCAMIWRVLEQLRELTRDPV